MPAFYAGKRVGKPLMGGHTYNALFNGKLVWPLGNDSWLMGIQAHISHDDGSEGANAFGPRNYGPKTLKTGTLQCNIFINTTGEVDKTITPRLYKID